MAESESLALRRNTKMIPDKKSCNLSDGNGSTSFWMKLWSLSRTNEVCSLKKIASGDQEVRKEVEALLAFDEKAHKLY